MDLRILVHVEVDGKNSHVEMSLDAEQFASLPNKALVERYFVPAIAVLQNKVRAMGIGPQSLLERFKAETGVTVVNQDGSVTGDPLPDLRGVRDRNDIY